MIEQLAVRIIGKGKKLGTGVFCYPANSVWCYVYTCRHVLGSACELELELELQECEYKVESDALETACRALVIRSVSIMLSLRLTGICWRCR